MVFSQYKHRGYQVSITRTGSVNTVWSYDWEVKEPASVGSRPLVIGTGSSGQIVNAKRDANQFIDTYIFNSGGSRPGGYKSPGEVLAAYKAGSMSYWSAVQYLMTYFGYNQFQAEALLKEDETNDDGITDDTVYPHAMYDCKTGSMYTAYNKLDHDKYAKRGYVHDMSECEMGGQDGYDEPGHEFALVGFVMILWLVGRVLE